MDERMPRRALAVAAVAVAVQAVALAVWLVARASPSRAVVAVFEERVIPIAALAVGWALVVVLAGGAIACGAAMRWPGILLAGWSQGAGILVVVVARLNGIADAAAIIALFALAAGAVSLQVIDDDRSRRRWKRPGAWAAAIGIVPWGVIAFAQVGSSLAGIGPSAGIRIVTLMALGFAAVMWWLAWRRRVPQPTDVAVASVGLSVVVWALVAVS